MRRREFLGALSLTCIPSTGRGQNESTQLIGILDNAVPTGLDGVSIGLRDSGYIEGKNIGIEVRSAGQYQQLPKLLDELLGYPVKVIGAIGGPAAVAAKSANSALPVVFSVGGDPTQLGLVRNLNRPGGNITGSTFFAAQVLPKQVGILRELVPNATAFGMLVHPDNPRAQVDLDEVQSATKASNIQLHVAHLRTEPEFQRAFTTFHANKVQAVIIAGDAFFSNARSQIAETAAQHSIPTIQNWDGYARAGGLVAYGPSMFDSLRQAGFYIGKILNGEKPGDLPVLQPTKFDLVVNTRTAKKIGLNIPPSLLARADEVIE